MKTRKPKIVPIQATFLPAARPTGVHRLQKVLVVVVVVVETKAGL